MTDSALPLDRAAELARHGLGDLSVGKQGVQRVGETRLGTLFRLCAVIDVAAIAERSLAVDDEDMRRDSRAEGPGHSTVTVLEIGKRVSPCDGTRFHVLERLLGE